MSMVVTGEAFDGKLSFLASNLITGLGNNLVKSFIWNILFYGSETWTLRKLGGINWRASKSGAKRVEKTNGRKK